MMEDDIDVSSDERNDGRFSVSIADTFSRSERQTMCKLCISKLLYLAKNSLNMVILTDYRDYVDGLALKYGNACNCILRTSACIYQQVVLKRNCTVSKHHAMF